ncbi:MAG: DNA translocase FtsK, partial [Candidatus Sungbacteria bacterium]|nr:DNA translocase FtsK [Candidatus Sungbacteria bacterium]
EAEEAEKHEEEQEIHPAPAPDDAQGVLDSMRTILKEALEKKPEESQAAGVAEGAQKQSPPAAENAEALMAIRQAVKKFAYKKPPLELLQGDRGTPSSGDIRANANIIKRTLENFGIMVEMGEVAIGPTVTQYALRPAEGVKLSKIVALHSNLSLALAAHPIRIEAPIPGKSLVGIEVPNRSIALVGLRSLISQKPFQEPGSPLLLGLGRDVAGAPVFADLARMPHLLISGSTGSGKSVAAHAIIASLLYRNGPDMLRFILVDPKRVELSMYNDIPHLLTPVITDPKKTIQALRWATKEMDRRYDALSRRQARDIVSFNAAAAKSKDEELLPYIVVIIDELADLMAVFPREVETSIIRLAQMARAVGIHLIVATQRPSVEVITGLIKANITSRMAFQMASQIDSRTILDSAGAEKLLGNGDMLFLAGDTARPRRIQGAFVSEPEVKRLVEYLREESDVPEYDEEIFATKMEDTDTGIEVGGEGDDPLYEEAKEAVRLAGKASASYLQRRLRVGYARAARLLDLMEAHGIIGPGDGAKSREILAVSEEAVDSDEGFES